LTIIFPFTAAWVLIPKRSAVVFKKIHSLNYIPCMQVFHPTVYLPLDLNNKNFNQPG